MRVRVRMRVRMRVTANVGPTERAQERESERIGLTNTRESLLGLGISLQIVFALTYPTSPAHPL